MFFPDEVLKTLRGLGYTESQNIADFWEANRAAISRSLRSHHPEMFNEWEQQVRWKSKIGQCCESAVRQYIENHQARLRQLDEKAFNERKDGMPHIVFGDERTLDFRDFAFQFEGSTRTLDDFQKMGLSRIYPQANLIGIDLRGIKLVQCVLRNACLAHANFDGAYIFGVTLENTTLNRASLRNSQLVGIRCSGGSLSGCDVSGAFVNAVHFADTNVSSVLQYEPVSYLHLICALFRALMGRRPQSAQGRKAVAYTTFLFNSTVGLTTPENRSFKSYVNWFQFVMRQIENFRLLPFRQQVGFSSSLFFTKAWTSYSVLAFWGLVTNGLFALYYHFARAGFKGMDDTLLSAFYFSFVTFTTLGYGDITPLPGLPQLAVIIEIILGYLTLGCMVFLIGYKVSDRF